MDAIPLQCLAVSKRLAFVAKPHAHNIALVTDLLSDCANFTTCHTTIDDVSDIQEVFKETKSNKRPKIPDGCELCSNRLLSTTKASGLKKVRRLRILPMTDKLTYSMPADCIRLPFSCFSSASRNQFSRTGLIFKALRGVMSSFSNLHF